MKKVPSDGCVSRLNFGRALHPWPKLILFVGQADLSDKDTFVGNDLGSRMNFFDGSIPRLEWKRVELNRDRHSRLDVLDL